VTPSGEVVATPMDAPADGAAAGAGARQPHRLKLKQPDPVAAWAIAEAQFGPGKAFCNRFKPPAQPEGCEF
jgi:hypothetical protein